MPCVLNAADEVVVEAFLNNRIHFTDIPRVIAGVLRRHKKVVDPCLEDILASDTWGRAEAEGIIRDQ